MAVTAGCKNGHSSGSASVTLPAGWKRYSMKTVAAAEASQTGRSLSITIGLPPGWSAHPKAPNSAYVHDLEIDHESEVFEMGPKIEIDAVEMTSSFDLKDILDSETKNFGKGIGAINVSKTAPLSLPFGDASGGSYDLVLSENNSLVDFKTKAYHAVNGNIWITIVWIVPSTSTVQKEADAMIKTLDIE